ncbi:MAG: 16S rRNA (uracil(1498)-N(3))-methyltransferase [Desulfovibrio sp.]|jgi:16S rRNA (uracil1498-N3)-methyltransferase|nr:16S rRNA (uracil(1498)-N(3))-methyltransferase [Desulfovibrio sp.]
MPDGPTKDRPLRSFYLAPGEWRAPYLLDPSESRHLSRVLRLRSGAFVRLFDGCGRFGVFRVEDVGGRRVCLSPVSEGREEEGGVRCTLAAAFSKALRRGWFMEKCVELGAFSVWFWQGDYSQAALPDTGKENWKAALIAGAKQCEAARVPELALLKGGAEAIIARRAEFSRAYLLYEGDTGGRLLGLSDLSFPGDLLLVLGPEGGFSPREVEAFAGADFLPVSLGGRVLRWETAAVLTLGLAYMARQGV